MAAKDQELRKKRIEISSWLSEIFGEEPVPDFEINAQTIQVLHQLSAISHNNERNTLMYTEDLKKKAEEYNADAQRVGSIMGRLLLGQNSFSQSGVACVQALAQSGALLSVKDASDTSYILSLQELYSTIHEQKENLQSQDQDLQRLSRKTQDILMKHNTLQGALEAVESRLSNDAGQNADRKEETILLKKKTEDNENKIAKLQTELAKTGVTESDFHDKLMEKQERLEKLENELSPLKSELQAYASLPPDAVEAKIKIEQLKRELDSLQSLSLYAMQKGCSGEITISKFEALLEAYHQGQKVQQKISDFFTSK